MKEKNLKIGDSILLFSINTLVKKGAIEILEKLPNCTRIRETSINEISFILSEEEKDFHLPKTIDNIVSYKGSKVALCGRYYYLLEYIRRRVNVKA